MEHDHGIDHFLYPFQTCHYPHLIYKVNTTTPYPLCNGVLPDDFNVVYNALDSRSMMTVAKHLKGTTGWLWWEEHQYWDNKEGSKLAIAME